MHGVNINIQKFLFLKAKFLIYVDNIFVQKLNNFNTVPSKVLQSDEFKFHRTPLHRIINLILDILNSLLSRKNYEVKCIL